MLKSTFGQVIKELRSSKDLSQESLGFKAGLDRTYIWRIENGKRAPSLEVVFLLAKALDMKPHEIVKRVEELQP